MGWEKDDPTISDRLRIAQRGFYKNSYGPTKCRWKVLNWQKKQYAELQVQLRKFLDDDVPRIEKVLVNAGPPPFM
ncbi:hypothetical protein [Maribacter luteus]|nr:hypothetical protein [Maribacter luteus]